MSQSVGFLTFNRGLISQLGLSRLDIDRGRLSADTMENWVPRVLGSMMLRPGLQYLGSTQSDLQVNSIPFVFNNSDKAIIEMASNGSFRVWVDDAVITRPSVTASVTNSSFTTDLTGWTDNDESGCSSAWADIGTSGAMRLTGNGTNAAIRDQTITVNEAGTEHALKISVLTGPVTIRVGTSTSDDSYIEETALGAGVHSLAFTPTGDFNVRLMSRLKRAVAVDYCLIESSGDMTVSTYIDDLSTIRYDQSGDVIFIAANGGLAGVTTGYTQRKIIRRAARSWSCELYEALDGPFMIENTSATTMTPSTLSGNGTLTASTPTFKSTNAPVNDGVNLGLGSIYKVVSNGQNVTQAITGENQFTNTIRVTGVGTSARSFTIYIKDISSLTATVNLQRSNVSDTGPWENVSGKSYTSPTEAVAVSFNDTLDNQIVWYRIGVATGDYTSGTATVELLYPGGSITGICRVTGYTSPTEVDIEIIQDFGALTASDNWAEGSWSDRRGWPTAVAFHEGRLFWAGRGKIYGSVSDAFDVFDDTTEGDSGPINRSIAQGPIDRINWIVSLERLMFGADGAEWSAKSSSFDEPLTPTAFSLKSDTSQGSAQVPAVKIDKRMLFVQKSGTRVFELSSAVDPSGNGGFGVVDITQLVPELCEPSIVKIVSQRLPDTRVHCVLSDGTVALLVIDRSENTLCWSKVTTDGSIIDACVMPGSSIEDDVYYVVERTINSNTVRYLEKWAQEASARGGTINKQCDSFITYSGSATNTITGLSHLEGEQVSVWADGADVGTATSTATSWTHTYTVSGGQITLATAASNVCVGLPYRAQWKSAKLAMASGLGIPLTKKKKIHGLGLILFNTHAQGLFFGRDFTNMDPLPSIRNGAPVDLTSVISSADDGSIVFPGDWSTDSRLCLEARSPRPCTISAAIATAEVHEQY